MLPIIILLINGPLLTVTNRNPTILDNSELPHYNRCISSICNNRAGPEYPILGTHQLVGMPHYGVMESLEQSGYPYITLMEMLTAGLLAPSPNSLYNHNVIGIGVHLPRRP